MTEAACAMDRLPAHLEKAITSYYALDFQPFLSLLDNTCIWIAPSGPPIRGKYEIEKLLETPLMPPFSLHNAQFELIDTGSADTAMVTGSYQLLSDLDSQAICACNQRLTCLFHRKANAWRILHIHVSNEWSEPVADEVFPLRLSRQTYRYAMAVSERNASAPRPVRLSLPLQDGGVLLFDPDDVLCIEAARKRSVLHLVDRSELIALSLGKALETLPDTFLHAHRSYAVNPLHVRNVDVDELVLSNGMRIPIPSRRRGEIYQKLGI